MNVLLRADIKSRAQWISSMVYCGVMSRNEAGSMKDMMWSALNEFLTPTNEWTEAQIANTKMSLQMESKDYIKK
jgi:hypothetical protein